MNKPEALCINIPVSWVQDYFRNNMILGNITRDQFYDMLVRYRDKYDKTPFVLFYNIKRDDYAVACTLYPESREYLCNSITEFAELVREFKMRTLLGIVNEQ
ncbi:hypothetical protein ACFBZI_10680 [Moraxella sp. ZJ142]|uniref:hypothetical protein n=1 Tax=Moraxella marmotae TaxID=3344520 RepID=UPI0035D4AD05